MLVFVQFTLMIQPPHTGDSQVGFHLCARCVDLCLAAIQLAKPLFEVLFKLLRLTLQQFGFGKVRRRTVMTR